MNAPDMDSAVQTAQPTISAMNIPPVPVSPVATSTRMVSTTVINVMPETGLTPTMAMAWAATGVKRNDRAKPTTAPTTAYQALWPTENVSPVAASGLVIATTKNSSAIRSVEPNWIKSTLRGDMSVCVRGAASTAAALQSLEAKRDGAERRSCPCG